MTALHNPMMTIDLQDLNDVQGGSWTGALVGAGVGAGMLGASGNPMLAGIGAILGAIVGSQTC